MASPLSTTGDFALRGMYIYECKKKIIILINEKESLADWPKTKEAKCCISSEECFR
jgi:hypothetical protein